MCIVPSFSCCNSCHIRSESDCINIERCSAVRGSIHIESYTVPTSVIVHIKSLCVIGLALVCSCPYTVLHQLDQKIIYPHYDFKHLTEKYFEIGMKLDDFLIQLVKYCYTCITCPGCIIQDPNIHNPCCSPYYFHVTT